MSPDEVLTSFHERREFNVGRVQSSVTEALFMELGAVAEFYLVEFKFIYFF